ncbi:MAG TPA: hypothetical protein VJ036_04045 [bacterium]|jgi:hypothetical protein|nr:hypothetical protein [bacterium]
MAILGILTLVIWGSWHYWLVGDLDPEALIRTDKEYTVTFWDFERPLSNGESYKRELEREFELFGREYPNITIRPKLFSWAQSQQVATAIRKAQPHVVSLGPLDINDLDCDLLVPVTYLSADELAGYLPLARKSLDQESDIAVWPRFLAPQLYLANVDLLQAVGISCSTLQATGIGWSDIVYLGEKLSLLPERPYVLAGLDYQGLLMAVAPRKVDGQPSGVANWPPNAGESAACHIQELQAQGFMPADITPRDYSGLDSFFSGRAALLAPVEPWMMRTIRTRQQRIEHGLLDHEGASLHQMVLMPPKIAPDLGLSVRTEKMVVVKQRLPADEVKAAVEWARFLSRSGILAAKLDVLPTHNSALEKWAAAWGLGNEAVLLKICDHDIQLLPYPNTQLEGMAPSSRIE